MSEGGSVSAACAKVGKKGIAFVLDIRTQVEQ